MSQNAHRLLLFFSDDQAFQRCHKVFSLLNSGEQDQAKSIESDWGSQINQAWIEDWFNQEYSNQKEYLKVSYETSTSYNLPLKVLLELFENGLQADCFEIFYDQVGEYGQFYFYNNQLVEKNFLLGKLEPVRSIISTQFECDDEEVEEVEDHGYTLPVHISKLIVQQQEQEAQANEMVDYLMSLMKTARETGTNPVELAKSACLIRALIKGLLQGVGFGIVTVLLFKGMWLWIGLSVILTIILPLIYTSRVISDFDTENGDEA